jgi:hypothetical protein
MNIMKEWFSCRRSASSHRNVPLVGRSPHDGIRHCRRLAQLGGAGLVMLPVLVAASACSSSTVTVHVLDWGVLDNTTNVETNVAGGGSITVNPDDTLYVTLRVQDPTGIKSMSVSADGMFSCSTRPDQNDVFWTAPDPLPAGLASTAYTLPSSATQSFVISNNNNAFAYRQLDCGIHRYQGPPGPEDYFATGGTLQFSGTETDVNGAQTTATLDLNPA